MAEVGFEDMGVYVTRRHNVVAQYIAMQPILDICEQYVWRTGAWVSRRWWDQEGLDLEGAKERAEEESDGEEAQCEEGLGQKETPGREGGRAYYIINLTQ